MPYPAEARRHPARLLANSLPATLLCFDDFDDTNVHPEDLYEWSKRGANLLEFDSPGMRNAVQLALSEEQIRYIILDYPFGRDHPQFRDVIDLSVFIDTSVGCCNGSTVSERPHNRFGLIG